MSKMAQTEAWLYFAGENDIMKSPHKPSSEQTVETIPRRKGATTQRV
jgi:hypothetical protein